MSQRRAPHPRRAWWIPAVLLLASAAQAQPAPVCGPGAPVPDFLVTDLGAPGAPGQASSALAREGLVLCSARAGYGPEVDGLRTLSQAARGDFSVQASLLALEAGQAGLEARVVSRAADGARFRVTAERIGDQIQVVAAARTEAGELGSEPVAVELPVALRLRREGGLWIGELSGDGRRFVTLLEFDSAATALAADQLAVGAAAASGQPGLPAHARITAPALVDELPPPDGACLDARLSPEGAEISLTGRRLHQVLGLRVAGTPAVIEARRDGLLRARLPRPAEAVTAGRVTLETADGDVRLGGALSFAGLPFVRGDVNEDGRVDRADAAWLADFLAGRAAWLSCPAAADVNGDGAVDGHDLRQLRGFLRTGRGAPVAPFPAPGLPDGPSLACGLGAPPVVEGLFDVQGRPLPAGTRLRAGDLVELRGDRLPAAPTARYFFGDVPTTALPFGTERSVTLEIGPVPGDGVRCPSLFEPSDPESLPHSRFGHLRAVRSDTLARHLCPDFIGSEEILARAEWSADSQQLRLPVPRSVDPSLGVQATLTLRLPATAGAAHRGARRIEVQARDASPRPSHAGLVEALSRAVDEALHGGRATPCEGRDWIATPDPAGGGILIRPFASLPPGGLPPPPAPQTNTLAPFEPPIIGGDGGIQAIQPSCADADAHESPRLRAWCALRHATAHTPLGLPRFESAVPFSVWHGGPAAVAALGHPADRPVSDKRTMVDNLGYQQMLAEGYLTPCAAAARVAYCTGGNQEWLNPLFPGRHLYKGFWRPLEQLPASADPEDLYSYQPPTGPRQYLVGLHISISTGTISQYWEWATFWFPKGDDTLTKGGTPLAQIYNPGCSTGDFQDQPQELEGVWRNYVLCVNHEDGGTPCGNPWGPFDECALDTCSDCHERVAIPFEHLGIGKLVTAWMSTMTMTVPVKACYDEIMAGVAKGQQPYVHLAPEECQ